MAVLPCSAKVPEIAFEWSTENIRETRVFARPMHLGRGTDDNSALLWLSFRFRHKIQVWVGFWVWFGLAPTIKCSNRGTWAPVCRKKRFTHRSVRNCLKFLNLFEKINYFEMQKISGALTLFPPSVHWNFFLCPHCKIFSDFNNFLREVSWVIT